MKGTKKTKDHTKTLLILFDIPEDLSQSQENKFFGTYSKYGPINNPYPEPNQRNSSY